MGRVNDDIGAIEMIAPLRQCEDQDDSDADLSADALRDRRVIPGR